MEVYLPIVEVQINVILILFVSFVIGFLSGLFRVGGGFLMTPFFLLGQDYSISFDGESYIETIYPGPLGDSPRTLCYWAKFIDNSEVGTFSYGSSSFGTDFISFHNWNASGDEPCIGPSFTMTGAGITYDDISASDYDWHHFAFVLNGI